MAVIDDGFSGESADVDLDTHTPDTTGTGWTNIETTGTRSIFVEFDTPADVVRVEGPENSDRTVYSAQGTYPSNEYDVEIDCINSDSGDDVAYLIGRLTDLNNYYAMGFLNNAADDIFLIKRVASVFTTFATGDIDINPAGVTLKFEIRDATKKIFYDNVERLSDPDDELTSIGEGGIAFGNIRLANDDLGHTWDLDNFLVTDFVAANPDQEWAATQSLGGNPPPIPDSVVGY